MPTQIEPYLLEALKWFADRIIAENFFIILIIYFLFVRKMKSGSLVDLIIRQVNSVFQREFEFNLGGVKLKAQSGEAVLPSEIGKRRDIFRQIQYEFLSKFSESALQHAENRKIYNKLRDLTENSIQSQLKEFGSKREHVRICVHILDETLNEAFFQLTDYCEFHKGMVARDHGKAGRRYSLRMGLGGAALRVGDHQYDPDVQSADEQLLIVDWGMTRPEAKRRGMDKRSFAGVAIADERMAAAHRDDGRASALAAILYLDSPAKALFGKDEAQALAALAAIEAGANEIGLVQDLRAITTALRDEFAPYGIAPIPERLYASTKSAAAAAAGSAA